MHTCTENCFSVFLRLKINYINLRGNAGAENKLCVYLSYTTAQLNSESEDRPPSPKRSKQGSLYTVNIRVSIMTVVIIILVPNTCTEPEHGSLDVPGQNQTPDATDEG